MSASARLAGFQKIDDLLQSLTSRMPGLISGEPGSWLRSAAMISTRLME